MTVECKMHGASCSCARLRLMCELVHTYFEYLPTYIHTTLHILDRCIIVLLTLLNLIKFIHLTAALNLDVKCVYVELRRQVCVYCCVFSLASLDLGVDWCFNYEYLCAPRIPTPSVLAS